MLRRVIRDAKHLEFVVIYTREPHARQMAFKRIAQPLNWEERRRLAEKTKKEFELDVLFLIDEMGDPSRKLFGDVPNPAIFVEKNGTIRDKLSWADASEVKRVIAAWKAARPGASSRPAKKKGGGGTEKEPRPAGNGKPPRRPSVPGPKKQGR